MRMLRLLGIVAVALSSIACGEDDEGGQEQVIARLVGSYQGTASLTGGGSAETYTTTVEVKKGSSADLLIDFLDMKNLRAKVNGENTFQIEDQNVNLTDAFGQAFTATVSGNGNLTGAALSINGQVSGPGGVFVYQVNATRL